MREKKATNVFEFRTMKASKLKSHNSQKKLQHSLTVEFNAHNGTVRSRSDIDDDEEMASRGHDSIIVDHKYAY